MIAFAELLDRLFYQSGRGAKLRLLTEYFARVPDPDRGYALAALTGELRFRHAKPALLRALVAERVDPRLFALSQDYVGDLAETAALIWPARPGGNRVPSLAEVVRDLETVRKADLPAHLAALLDALDASGRFALLKLITGSLRIGVSARLARTALALHGAQPVTAIEEVWHGLDPPYEDLFAWLEGRGPRPHAHAAAPFRPVMLAHPLAEADLAGLDPGAFRAEWKWDGIRVQAVVDGGTRRLYTRTGDDISQAFPDLIADMAFEAALDGELLVIRDGTVAPFNDLQQRLNRKTVSPALLRDFPAALRAYDLLAEGGEDLRSLPFDLRRARLEDWSARHAPRRIDLSPVLRFATWEELAALRAGALPAGAEGVMLKHAASPYLPGRPNGPWFKWKRDPHRIDAVLLYAQRGHGKRSSFYSDYTFGVWRGDALVPVGKAYFGFTDAELVEIDRFVRRHTINRFGPVREVAHGPDLGLVLEIAFEGIAASPRHRSGLALRFPRIARIRWDKPPVEADRIETLEGLLAHERARLNPGSG